MRDSPIILFFGGLTILVLIWIHAKELIFDSAIMGILRESHLQHLILQARYPKAKATNTRPKL